MTGQLDTNKEGEKERRAAMVLLSIKSECGESKETGEN